MKICKKCNIEKDLDCYGKNNSTKDKLQYICKSCCKIKMDEYVSRPGVREKMRLNTNQHQINNPKYYKQKDLENYNTNKDLWKLKNKIYKSENKDKINTHLRKKYQTDTIYRTKRLITSLIVLSLKNNGYTKKSRTYQILGCTYEELRNHLEQQFLPWMNWDNQGKYDGTLDYGWDIDHIIPISSAKTEEELVKLNHYTNLQPLCSYTNRYIKVNKLNY